MSNGMKLGLSILLSIMVSTSAMADWELDGSASHIGFGSVKNDLIAENHSFGSLQGVVSADGNATVLIDLTSVETNIPIRNERLMQMLFHTDTYGLATISGKLKTETFTALGVGDHITQNLDLSIKLHGNELTKSIPVKVVRSGTLSYDVSSLGPIYVHASQFALSDGVEALRKIAGLQSIDLMVPVTVNLRFNKIGM